MIEGVNVKHSKKKEMYSRLFPLVSRPYSHIIPENPEQPRINLET